jgi:hypothetical protein
MTPLNTPTCPVVLASAIKHNIFKLWEMPIRQAGLKSMPKLRHLSKKGGEGRFYFATSPK